MFIIVNWLIRYVFIYYRQSNFRCFNHWHSEWFSIRTSGFRLGGKELFKTCIVHHSCLIATLKSDLIGREIKFQNNSHCLVGNNSYATSFMDQLMIKDRYYFLVYEYAKLKLSHVFKCMCMHVMLDYLWFCSWALIVMMVCVSILIIFALFLFFMHVHLFPFVLVLCQNHSLLASRENGLCRSKFSINVSAYPSIIGRDRWGLHI